MSLLIKIIITSLDYILWLIMFVHAIYLLYFAWKGGMLAPYSKDLSNKNYAKVTERKFAVFFPAYKEDKVILISATDFLKQKYPKHLYDVVVISDKMEDSTNEALASMPIKLVKVNFENSSKAKALTYASEVIGNDYDVAIVMDADNIVDDNFLEKMNLAFESGVQAVQAHRVAKNLNTTTAILDAVSEEINNSIFRAGHVRSGLSSALIGSGMGFTYSWFADNIKKATTAGEDKELEALLLIQGIYIDYLPNVFVYDEKTTKEQNFGNQRKRWLAAQFGALARGLRDLPKAIATRNIDYIDKLFQWIMLPRILVIGFTLVFAVMVTMFDLFGSIKWWILLWIVLLAMAMAIPDNLGTRDFYRSLRRAPVLALSMFTSLFKLKGVNSNFIHTEHGDDETIKIKEDKI